MKNLGIVIMFGLIAGIKPTMAQDHHFSQYDILPVRLNAAMTGMFKNYAYKSGIIYRNQWRSLSVKPFSAFNLSYEMPINSRWGVGGYLMNFDGAKIYNEFNFVASGAYRITKPGQDIHVLTTGLQMGFINKHINDKELTFNNQYQSGGFNPDLNSKESFERFSKFMPEFNIGFYYKYGGWHKIKPYVGFALHHISSPKNQFVVSEINASRLPRRYVLHGGFTYKIDADYTLEFKTREMWQGKASEYYLGFDIEYLIDRQTNTRVRGGVYYRVKDAIVLAVGLEYKNLAFVTSYDITVSDLNDYNRSFGGLEFALRFAPRISRSTKY